MSDKYQTFVSVDMNWQPSKEAAAEAERLLCLMAPGSDGVQAEFSDQLDYINPVCYWAGALCPCCAKRVCDDWFGDTMVDWYKSETRPMNIVMPCCKASSTLDALQFIEPAAFARFRLEVMNAPIAISEEQIHELEDVLKTKLRKIWTRV